MHRTKGKKHRKSDLSKITEKYRKMYFSWRKIKSPALKCDIHFTNKGWQHIQQDKSRTGVEKEERLKLLIDAKHILENSTFFQDKRLQNYRGITHVHYGLVAFYNGRKITVVLIEGSGQIDFFSVFKA